MAVINLPLAVDGLDGTQHRAHHRQLHTLTSNVIAVGVTTIIADTTISADLVFPPGARIDVARGATLTLTGAISAGHYQIFSGAGTVDLSAARITAASVLWFGAQPGQPTYDSAPAFRAAAASRAGVIDVPAGEYALKTAHATESCAVYIDQRQTWVGAGGNRSKLIASNALEVDAAVIVDMSGDSDNDPASMRNIRIGAGLACTRALWIKQAGQYSLEQVRVTFNKASDSFGIQIGINTPISGIYMGTLTNVLINGPSGRGANTIGLYITQSTGVNMSAIRSKRCAIGVYIDHVNYSQVQGECEDCDLAWSVFGTKNLVAQLAVENSDRALLWKSAGGILTGQWVAITGDYVARFETNDTPTPNLLQMLQCYVGANPEAAERLVCASAAAGFQAFAANQADFTTGAEHMRFI